LSLRCGERIDAGEATAAHAIFADHGRMDASWHFPKPLVIWVTPTSNRIFVEVSLFGEACHHRGDVIEAMARIMLPRQRGGEGGITLDSKTRGRGPWKLLDVYWRQRWNYPVPPAKRTFIISAVTPLKLGNSAFARGDFADLFATLGARAFGLARWHGIDLPQLSRFQQVRAMARRVKAEFLEPARAAAYERRSRSFGASPRLEQGLSGHIVIRDYPDPFWHCFALGTLFHMGYDTSQGHGRYVISDP
jgi:hypothetical protein